MSWKKRKRKREIHVRDAKRQFSMELSEKYFFDTKNGLAKYRVMINTFYFLEQCYSRKTFIENGHAEVTIFPSKRFIFNRLNWCGSNCNVFPYIYPITSWMLMVQKPFYSIYMRKNSEKCEINLLY